MSQRFRIRCMRQQELQQVLAVQNAIYPASYHEPANVFASKLALAPQLCLVMEEMASIIGYLLAHPWMEKGPPPLFAELAALPEGANSLFIHDLALLPQARGTKVAERMLKQAQTAACAARLESASLVAVQGADRYWQRFGFRQAAIDSGANFPGRYGDSAIYMQAPLDLILL